VKTVLVFLIIASLVGCAHTQPSSFQSNAGANNPLNRKPADSASLELCLKSLGLIDESTKLHGNTFIEVTYESHQGNSRVVESATRWSPTGAHQITVDGPEDCYGTTQTIWDRIFTQFKSKYSGTDQDKKALEACSNLNAQLDQKLNSVVQH